MISLKNWNGNREKLAISSVSMISIEKESSMKFELNPHKHSGNGIDPQAQSSFTTNPIQAEFTNEDLYQAIAVFLPGQRLPLDVSYDDLKYSKKSGNVYVTTIFPLATGWLVDLPMAETHSDLQESISTSSMRFSLHWHWQNPLIDSSMTSYPTWLPSIRSSGSTSSTPMMIGTPTPNVYPAVPSPNPNDTSTPVDFGSPQPTGMDMSLVAQQIYDNTNEQQTGHPPTYTILKDIMKESHGLRYLQYIFEDTALRTHNGYYCNDNSSLGCRKLPSLPFHFDAVYRLKQQIDVIFDK